MQKIEPVVRVLKSLEASFALIGGHAVGLRGHPRMTLDYDLLTTERRVLQRDAWGALEQNGAKVDVRRGDSDDPLAGVVHIELPDGTEVDVVVGKWKWVQGVVDRAETLDVGALAIPVPLTSDLILLKLAAGGYHDLQDVKALLDVSERATVAEQVDERIDELSADVREAWQAVKSARGR